MQHNLIILRRILFLFFIVFGFNEFAVAQTDADSNVVALQDTLPKVNTPVVAVKRDTLPKVSTRVVVPKDTLPVVSQDTLPVNLLSDSVSRKPEANSNWEIDPTAPLIDQLLSNHPYFGFASTPVIVHSGLKQFKGKEILFFSLIALLLAFALLRQAFPKYFNDLVRLLFRTTLKQKQIREQLMQTPLPSLLLNMFFVVSGGFYINILLHHFKITPVDNYWLLGFYCTVGLAIIYTVKFVGLKICGWLFNIKGIADTYVFVVFIINKVIGIFLLPFLVLLTFTEGTAYMVALVLSWCGIGLLIIYRFLLTYAAIRNQVRFNPFHFFLYLCAFEIAPLLLIYKALLFFFQ